ncbi:hypothetical protein Tco_0026419 [Tanacetum coccineum]
MFILKNRFGGMECTSIKSLNHPDSNSGVQRAETHKQVNSFVSSSKSNSSKGSIIQGVIPSSSGIHQQVNSSAGVHFSERADKYPCSDLLELEHYEEINGPINSHNSIDYLSIFLYIRDRKSAWKDIEKT